MTLTVNGEAREVADGMRLGALLELVAGHSRGAAAAVDGEVIPRGEWDTYRLSDGQFVEVLTAVQGG